MSEMKHTGHHGTGWRLVEYDRGRDGKELFVYELWERNAQTGVLELMGRMSTPTRLDEVKDAK